MEWDPLPRRVDVDWFAAMDSNLRALCALQLDGRAIMWANEPGRIVHYPTPRRWHSQPDEGHDE